MAPLPLFPWERSAQLGAPRPVNAAVWPRLGRSSGELPSILNNGVDNTLNWALTHTMVRLRNEMAPIVLRPMGDRAADRLQHLSIFATIRRLPAEDYAVAVADTNTLLAACSLRDFANPVGTRMGAGMLATPQRPPSPSPPQYGAGSSSFAQFIYAVATGAFENPPSLSGPGKYVPEDGPSQGYGSGYGSRSGFGDFYHPGLALCPPPPPSCVVSSPLSPPLRG